MSNEPDTPSTVYRLPSAGSNNVAEWLAEAIADAERRGLPELKPMLEGLAQATTLLRTADWNDQVVVGR